MLLIHDPVHLDFIKSIPVKPQTDLNKMAERLDSIYLNPDTYDCALLSAGSLLAVVDTVCQVGVEQHNRHLKTENLIYLNSGGSKYDSECHWISECFDILILNGFDLERLGPFDI